jgi:diketogulonate reductase-like aldo/keto reductase
MGMEYLDMYLVHWPVKLKPWNYSAVPPEDDFEPLDLESTWAGMEKCLDLGLCRCIGVSNFSSKKIQSLLDFASVPPAVNQVPYKKKTREQFKKHTLKNDYYRTFKHSDSNGDYKKAYL